ncbi:MAG: hypothetical protein ACLGH7_12715 [Actinomycetes bacterium]
MTLVLIAVICASHQLTPFLLLIAVTALTLSGRIWPSRLPLIIGVLLVLWLAYPASTYLAGHPPLANAGLPTAIEANVVDRTSGSPGHLLVVQGRIGLTLVLWVIAAIGAVRDWRRKSLDARVVILALAPLLLFPMQAYGGEMLIRISLFALPFVAMLACSVLLPVKERQPSARSAWILAPTFILLAVLTVTGRFGNAQYDVFSDDEMSAVKAVDRLAPPDSAIISAAHPTPWRSEDYLNHRYRTIEDLCPTDLSAAACGPVIFNYAKHSTGGGFLLLTRSSESSLVIQGQITPQGFDDLENWLAAQEGVQLAFGNDDARVYKVAP